MRFDPAYMRKQWVGRWQGPVVKFNVFTTGDPSSYLLSALDPYDCEGGVEFPVRRRRFTALRRSGVLQPCL